MDIEKLKELRAEFEQVRKYNDRHYMSTVTESDVIALIDEAIARQSVKSEDVQRAINVLATTSEGHDVFAFYKSDKVKRAIDLAITALQAYEPWVSVGNVKPETDKNVFLTVKRKSYFSDEMIYKIIIGCYFAPYEYEAENWNDYDTDFCDYHEESDTYYIKEGWFECAMFGDDYSYFFINDGWEVTHWKPMISPKGE